MEHAHGFQDLLRRAQAGDEQAFADLLNMLRPWLDDLTRRYAAGPADESASDLGQEARLRVWQKLGQFRGADDEDQALAMFKVWVAQIVRRVGLNARRDHSAQRRKPPGKLKALDPATSSADSRPGEGVDPPARGHTPSSNAAGAEQSDRLRAALDRLEDATDRAIVRLRFFEGLSLRQIAERLDVNAEKVRQRYHAVLRRLERELEGDA
jgi:RNA polymerase sigma-70 factor (ECF subfamily)